MRQVKSVTILAIRRCALPTMNMQSDPERARSHGIERSEKNTKTSQVQNRARKEKADPASMLEDAAASLEPFEPAVNAVKATKVE